MAIANTVIAGRPAALRDSVQGRIAGSTFRAATGVTIRPIAPDEIAISSQLNQRAIAESNVNDYSPTEPDRQVLGEG